MLIINNDAGTSYTLIILLVCYKFKVHIGDNDLKKKLFIEVGRSRTIETLFYLSI